MNPEWFNSLTKELNLLKIWRQKFYPYSKPNNIKEEYIDSRSGGQQVC
jgi:hypothetical protein